MALKRHGLAHKRRSAGLSQEQLAERLGVERSTVGRWERAETDPLPFIRPRLAEELRISLEELSSLLDDVRCVEPQRDERLTHVLDNPAGVDLVAAARLRQRVQALGEEYDRVPSALLLAAAGQCHGQVAFLRQNAPSGRVLRELLEAEAESATLMGQLVWDASQRRDHATTLAYFDAALAAARKVGDGFAEAHAQLRRSYVALYGLRNPSEGLALAESAARAVGVKSNETGASDR
ncbi:helix-turn-helix transcriptional regulator [Spirillospora sp. NPDC047279]|uniref:helix-turn-helix transcriptional regulator n=1 Tax=Spirillospora sp. NPDC047279 TaxID=3155478 RepID=UPI0034098AF5